MTPGSHLLTSSKIFRAGKAAGENDLVSSINKWQFFKRKQEENNVKRK